MSGARESGRRGSGRRITCLETSMQARPTEIDDDVLSAQGRADGEKLQSPLSGLQDATVDQESAPMVVSLLTGGSDRPYVFGLTKALFDRGMRLEVVGSDELDFPEFRGVPALQFLNLRGNTLPDAGAPAKVARILRYYARLIWYAGTTKAKIFHLLWNNRFESFDRTVLMLYYRLLRKRIVMTVHNVNAGRRDRTDSWLNRATLRVQYRLADHLFVHTEKMRMELAAEFGVNASKVSVIPFGINNYAPRTDLTAREAKRRLGLKEGERTLLFFGRITPYKGLEHLVAAFRSARTRIPGLRLVIAGRIDRCEKYWQAIRTDIHNEVVSGEILVRSEYIPEAETEVYFKAADALVLPYRDIYQSGVLFLAQSFGLPVLASDAGSLHDEVVEGQNGFIFGRESHAELAEVIERYFRSTLYAGLEGRRKAIREQAAHKHSWSVVARMTTEIYHRLNEVSRHESSLERCEPAGPLDVHSSQ